MTQIIQSVAQLQSLVSEARAHGKSVGLVPTMGALHDGHIQLVRRCVEENDLCVTSVFVNPTQFNDKNDLDKYPRTLEADHRLLQSAGCNFLFAPSVEEMYPQEDTRTFDFAPLDQVMEGPSRPGHFNGVAQIVSKLFDAALPHRAYFGLKDFQQLAIIRRMVEMLNHRIDIVACPIVRETDGLAMSSRNTRLSIAERNIAPFIYQTLQESVKLAGTKPLSEVKRYVEEQIVSQPLFRLEYYEIVDGNTLQPVKQWTDSPYIVGCIALYNGEIRLIDNIVYQENGRQTNR